MKKIYILLLLTLLLSSFGVAYTHEITEIYSDETTDRYLITTLPACEGNVLIKIRGSNPIDHIEFPHFKINERGLYEAPCSSLIDNQIILEVKDKITNEYDIVVEHYIDDSLDLNAVRTLNFNNVAINPQEVNKKPSIFIVDWIKTIIFVLVCVSILVLIVLGIYKMVKHESQEDREQREFLESKDKLDKDDTPSIDKELDRIMNEIGEGN